MHLYKGLFLGLVLLFPFCMFGQYLDNTSTWLYARFTQDFTGDYTDLRTITIDGDTTIQGNTYYKRFREETHTFTPYPSGTTTSSTTSKTFFDLVRDDGTAFYTNIGGQDTMTLDFTKIVGDSLSDWANVCTIPIDSIEIIYLGVTPLKKWNQGSFSSTFIYPYIEGIGSVHGGGLFLNCLLIGLPDYSLVCYKKQGDEYIYSTDYDCSIHNSITSLDNPIETVDVFPNPSSGKLTIQLKNNWKGNLLLFDIQGQLLSEKEVHGSTFHIDLNSYTPGVYFLKMIASDKTLTTYRKIIRF